MKFLPVTYLSSRRGPAEGPKHKEKMNLPKKAKPKDLKKGKNETLITFLKKYIKFF